MVTQTVAFLGPVTSYTHQAAKSAFGPEHDLVAAASITDVFAAVQAGTATFGVVPFENSTHGPVAATLDGLADRDGVYADLTICGEVYLAVHHYLLGRRRGAADPTSEAADPDAAADLGHIERIYSHPQAFGQTTAFVKKHFGGDKKMPQKIDAPSTSQAAALAAADASGTSAAISSALAAETTGLDVLARCIEDRSDNTTRFVVLSRRSTVTQTVLKVPKSLVSFTVPHRRPGALASVLDCFRRAGLNLTSINSLPSMVRPFQYLFMVEFEHGEAEGGEAGGEEGAESPHGRAQRVLAEVATLAETYRLLGTWNRPDPVA